MLRHGNRRSRLSSSSAAGGAARPYRPGEGFRYIIFNKPFGVLSQFTPAEAGDKPTLAAFGFPPHVYPVGRLDHDSEGLLLLSDDPGLTDYLLNPAHHHTRTYLAQVERIPDAEAIDRLEKGVIIEGKRTRPAAAVLLAQPPALPERSVPIRFRLSVPTAWLRLTLTEGRNRQVRRMTAAVGHPTLRLVRERIGRLDLFTLGIAPGTWRDLTTPELQLAMQQWRGSHRSEPPSA